MPDAMKGLLKGLRYISHVFAEEEREPELQIGDPTDVKHVAHIGWDGPTATAPSWMTQFKGEGENPDPTLNGADSLGQSPSKRKTSKHSKRNGSDTSSNMDSPKRASASDKKTRRKKNKGTSSDAPSSSKPTKVKKKKDKNPTPDANGHGG